METAAAHGAVDLLGSHAGDQAATVRAEVKLNAELIASHQAAGGVEKGQLTAAVFPHVCPQQLERSCASPLVFGAAVGGLELQPAAAVPGLKGLHEGHTPLPWDDAL